MELIILVGGGWWRCESVEVEGGFECLSVPGEGVGEEATTEEVGHEGMVDGGVGCSQDEVSTVFIVIS